MPSASVIGREHVRVGRNNQDGWAEAKWGQRQVVVVCDGCSSQPFSEVGARLGAHTVAQACQFGPLENAMSQAAAAVCAMLDALAKQCNLERYGLFTVQAAVFEASQVIVFGAGDGVWSVDGHVQVLRSESNAPNYPAYGRADCWATHFRGSATEVVVATDGLSEALDIDSKVLSELLTPAGVWANPAALQRGLNLLAARLKLPDDCTVVAMRGES